MLFPAESYVEHLSLKSMEENLPVRSFFQLFSNYLELTKPKLSGLVMSTSLVGVVLASKNIDSMTPILSLLFIALVVGGACVLNCYIEIDVDSKMERTKERVLPSGKLGPGQALIFGCLLLGMGFSGLFFLVNWITGFLAIIATVLYLFSYTPLKQKSEYAVYVGAIPGAIPPIMGWTAVTGELGPFAYCLFGILLVWQLPHFWAISIYHAQDYNTANIKIYPSQKGLDATTKNIFSFTIILAFVSLLPVILGETLPSFSWVCLGLNAPFIYLSSLGIFKKKDELSVKSWAKNYFYGSIFYLPLLLGGMIFFK